MLVEFRVENFYSIQKEQILSFIAGDDEECKKNFFQIANIELLRSAVIYGANAAGKTNFIKAITTMKTIVLKSATESQMGDKLPVIPFLLGEYSSEYENQPAPTMFEVKFVKDNVCYRYGFRATPDQVVDEWLYMTDSQEEEQMCFRRIKHINYEFGLMFSAEEEQIINTWKKITRDNALFLSTAVQLNSKQLQPISDWFKSYIQVTLNTNGFRNSSDVTIKFFQKNPKRTLEFLQSVDLDIKDLHIAKERTSEIINQDILILQESPDVLFDDFNDKNSLDIKTIHTNRMGDEVIFDMNWESSGTQKFFRFLGPILEILEKGGILIVDELHNSFHPLMTKYIIGLFHNKEINQANAQLVFTTHDVSLLDKTLFGIDQVYFCEKCDKATNIYSLYDFMDFNVNDMDYQESYLLGRFGALPFLKTIS